MPDRDATNPAGSGEELPTQANGGWIGGYAEGFDNSTDSYRLTTLSGQALDPTAKAYFREYLESYFNEEFVYGWGTEDILDMLANVPAARSWLDLGAGTSTFLWSIPLHEVEHIVCCDVVPEALAVLEDFAAQAAIPRCYRDVMAMYGCSDAGLAARRRALAEFAIFDFFQPWPADISDERYDLVTAIGAFSLAPNEQAYAACFRHMHAALARGTRVVGADWIRSAAFVAQEGHDNRYVSRALLDNAARRAGFTVHACRQVGFDGDPLYDGLVAWSLERV
jgi:hypothetical protein